MPPGKTFWDMIAMAGNGLLVLLALILVAWAACSSGGDTSYEQISLPADVAASAGVEP